MSEGTERLSSALADRYRILSRLGEGGMATVYLAEDLKHDRKVAVKVLRPELAAVLGADRFVQEIKTTAALQHPHILPLFDSGTADGFLFYVMPFIDGETLRSKLDRETQFGIDEAVTITVAVADALDYAHRQGVIHRDIKPENILLHDGRPMVADFGIALAVSAAAGGRMTETGLSLGTPHYMSPEQATAEKEISARSDVYSLGSVLYEMLAGEPPHLGNSAQQIIMKIIADDARPVSELRKSVPPNVAAAVAKSLAKLPADRFATAKAFGEALGDAGYAPPGTSTSVTSAPPSGVAWRRRWQLALATHVVLLLAVAAAWLRAGPEPAVSRQQVVLWGHALEQILSPGIERYSSQAAIAPDGSSIVYSDSVGPGVQLFLKLRGEGTPQPLDGTEGGSSPFFSPDGRWVGYATVDGRLRKVPVEGGNSITLTDDVRTGNTSAAWLDDGTIVYVGAGRDLRTVPSAGGESTDIQQDEVAGGGGAVLITALPGGRRILYTHCPGNCAVSSSIRTLDLDTGRSHELVPSAAGAWYASSGHLLYTDRSGGLFAAALDLDRMALTSEAVPVIDDVAPTAFAISVSGTVVYSIASGGDTRESELVWVTRDGAATPVDSTWRGRFEYPALSPDGEALAVSLTDGTTQLWIWRPDGRRLQLTQDGTVNWRPFWQSDGQSVAFLSNRRGGDGENNYDAYRITVDGSAPPELLLHHTYGLWEVEFTSDGRWMVVRSDEDGNGNVRGQRQDGDTALVPLVVDQGRTGQVALSPDGRWLAYVSTGSGSREVYLAPFPDMTTRLLISRNGGTEPRWAHSGRELFYKSGNQFMAVELMPGQTLSPGTPRPLFSLAGFRSARNRQQYDVAPDDQRFVMIRELGGGSAPQVFYVENWFQELEAKVNR